MGVSKRLARSTKKEIICSPLDAVIAIDENEKIIEWNLVAEKYFGWKKKNILGEILSEKIVPQKSLKIYKSFLKKSKKTKAFIKTVFINKKDNEFPVELSVASVKENRKVISYLFIRKTAEEKKPKTDFNRDIKKDTSEQEELINVFIKSLPGVFYLFNEHGKFLRWNESLEKVSGYSTEEISNMQPTDFFEEGHDQAYVTEQIGKVFTTGEVEAEVCFLTKSKTKIPFHFNGKLIEHKGQRCLIGMGIDITRREQAEKNLQLAWFTINNTSDSVIWIHKDASFEYFNRTAHESLGYTREEFLSMTVPDIDINYSKEIWPLHWQELKEKKVMVFESANKSKDGIIRNTEVAVNFFEYEGEEYNCSFVRDISLRKASEHELHVTKDRLELATQIAGLGIWQIDFVNNVWQSDKRVREILGIEENTITFEKYSALVHPDDREEKSKLDNIKLSSNSEEYYDEYRIVRPTDGQVRFIKSQGRIIRDENGRALSGVSVIYDQTKEKLAEQKILHSLSEKEVLIKEIHHRTKNNLQLISSIIFLKIKQLESPFGRVFLEETRQKIKAIALIHERLLQTGSVNQVDISDYLSKLIRDLQMSMLRNELNINVIEDIESENFNLDIATYCGLIINELVTNAFKHAFEGRTSGNIKINLCKHIGKHKLVVSDDGSSLPEHIQPAESGTFGMQLLNVFIKQLKGTCTIDRLNGTAFTIIF